MSASGVPIVASDHCDLPEAVLHERTGLIFPEGDVDALAESMLRMADEANRWEEYGTAGRAHVAAEYDARAQAPRLEALYDELLSKAAKSMERAGTPDTREPGGTQVTHRALATLGSSLGRGQEAARN